MPFSLTITFLGEPGSSVAPTYAAVSQTAGSGGNPDQISFSGGYIGADTVVAWVATLSSSATPTVPQIKAGTGGNVVESSSVVGFDGTQTDFAGFTDDSTPTHVAFYSEEQTNGGASAISVIPLSGVDFTDLAFVSAATNSAGDEVTITFNDEVWGTNNAGDFTIPGHTIGGITGAAGATTRTLTGISPAIANGDVDTISGSTGNLTDDRGNPLTAFSGESITNNVPAASGPNIAETIGTYTDNQSSGTTFTFNAATLPAGDYIALFGGVRSTGNFPELSSLSVPGSSDETELVNRSFGAQVRNNLFSFSLASSQSTPTITVNLVAAISAATLSAKLTLLRIDNFSATGDTAFDEGTTDTLTDTIDVLADGLVIVSLVSEDTSGADLGDPITWVGVNEVVGGTEFQAFSAPPYAEYAYGAQDSLGAETGRTITVTTTNTITRFTMTAVAIS